jgi:hypothetical protein
LGLVALSNLEVLSLSARVALYLLELMGQVASCLLGREEVMEAVPWWYHHVHDVVWNYEELVEKQEVDLEELVVVGDWVGMAAVEDLGDLAELAAAVEGAVVEEQESLVDLEEGVELEVFVKG